MCRNLNDVKLL